MNRQTIDVFICVHERDVGYLLELALQSYTLNFAPKGRLFLVTNNQQALQEFVGQLGFEQQIEVMGDQAWLSRHELTLPGWFRQQIVKLRAYEFCETKHFCNLGADTLLLQPISRQDLIVDDFPILYYRRHVPPTVHFAYECMRLFYVSRLLHVKPIRALRYIDFVSDLFCFDRETLMDLNRYIKQRYGNEPYYTMIRQIPDVERLTSHKKFGEWTLYSTYLLDGLKRSVRMRNSAEGFLHQIHSRRMLRSYRFDTKVAHFVGKDFDRDYIQQQIARRGLALANCFVSLNEGYEDRRVVNSGSVLW